MALSTPLTLGEVLGIHLHEEERIHCIAMTRKAEQCRDPVAKHKTIRARHILGQNVTFLERDDSLIDNDIHELVDLLMRNKHPNIASQKKDKLNGWLALWDSHLHQHCRVQSNAEMMALIEQSVSEVTENNIYEVTHMLPMPFSDSLSPNTRLAPSVHTETLPAIVQYPSLPIYPEDHMDIMDEAEDGAIQVPEMPVQKLDHDASDRQHLLPPNETSLSFDTCEHNAFSISILFHVFQIFAQLGLGVCNVMKIQYGTVHSQDERGKPRTESIVQFKMLLGVSISFSRMTGLLWIMVLLYLALY